MAALRRVGTVFAWLVAAVAVMVGASIAYAIAHESGPSARGLFDVVAAGVSMGFVAALVFIGARLAGLQRGRGLTMVIAAAVFGALVAGIIGSRLGDATRRHELDLARAACSPAEVAEYARLDLGPSAGQPIGWSGGGCHVEIKTSDTATSAVAAVQDTATTKGWTPTNNGADPVTLVHDQFTLTITVVPTIGVDKTPAVLQVDLRTTGDPKPST